MHGLKSFTIISVSASSSPCFSWPYGVIFYSLQLSQAVTNFIHENPNFKLFECEAIKDAINVGLFGSLGYNALKFVPHQNLKGPKPHTKKDKADGEAFERQRKDKEKAPLERKKKKEKLLSQARCAAESQAAWDRALDDIPLPSPTSKRKRSILGQNFSLGDRNSNTETVESR
ncbi:hypothetical protein R1flu_019838 [Riccia fluitans]|uniref:Uncharacterized protein n=1 Tax=Riccia fluitans TaxID=41844 RepID=A0ABD1ZL77_9MARC